jgi:hypothetical protein
MSIAQGAELLARYGSDARTTSRWNLAVVGTENTSAE